MIRAGTSRVDGRPARLLISAIAGLLLLAGCQTGPSSGPAGTGTPAASTTETGTPAGSPAPSGSADAGPTPTQAPGASPVETLATGSPGPASPACTGSEANREFFRQAGTSMGWPVYCAVLPGGWILETGRYRLRDGGQLEVTYRGPGDAHLSVVEGNICAGADVDTCAPRDALVGPAAFGDREGELGRLANGLVLDVDRGASPSWRVTGVGLSEDEFRAVGAALARVEG